MLEKGVYEIVGGPTNYAMRDACWRPMVVEFTIKVDDGLFEDEANVPMIVKPEVRPYFIGDSVCAEMRVPDKLSPPARVVIRYNPFLHTGKLVVS